MRREWEPEELIACWTLMDFRCNNSAYRPVMDAVALLRRYADRERVQFYDDTETVPLDGVVAASWRSAVVDETGRVARVP